MRYGEHDSSEASSPMFSGAEWRLVKCAKPAPTAASSTGCVGMQLGRIGLGRMGSNMVRRLIRGQHGCWSLIFNRKRPAPWSRRAAWELSHAPIV